MLKICGFYVTVTWTVSENSDSSLKDEKTPQSLIYTSFSELLNLNGNFWGI
jgi:hypothetical protein